MWIYHTKHAVLEQLQRSQITGSCRLMRQQFGLLRKQAAEWTEAGSY